VAALVIGPDAAADLAARPGAALLPVAAVGSRRAYPRAAALIGRGAAAIAAVLALGTADRSPPVAARDSMLSVRAALALRGAVRELPGVAALLVVRAALRAAAVLVLEAAMAARTTLVVHGAAGVAAAVEVLLRPALAGTAQLILATAVVASAANTALSVLGAAVPAGTALVVRRAARVAAPVEVLLGPAFVNAAQLVREAAESVAALAARTLAAAIARTELRKRLPGPGERPDERARGDGARAPQQLAAADAAARESPRGVVKPVAQAAIPVSDALPSGSEPTD
jgi:hypothetical protein